MTLRTIIRDLSYSAGEVLIPRSIKNKGMMGSLRRAASEWAREGYVLSYPKSGRTWLRTMMGFVVCRRYGLDVVNPMEIQHFWKMSSDVPNIGFTHDDYPNLKRGTDVETDKSRYSRKKVLLLTRDPRDVVVSYYFDAKNRMKVIDCDLTHFVHHEKGSIDALVAFYNAWAANRHVPRGFHWITYEDMHRDPVEVLRSTLEFFGMPRPEEGLLQEAIKFASFENMRKTELSDGFKHERLRPVDLNNPESFKVRRGKVGGYTEYLSPADIEYIEGYVSERLHPFFDRYRSPVMA